MLMLVELSPDPFINIPTLKVYTIIGSPKGACSRHAKKVRVGTLVLSYHDEVA